MPLPVQGAYNKQFVSAISLLDQREINPALIDQTRDASFLNIMKLVGRTKPTDAIVYHNYVNNPVFATAVVSSVTSGYGTSIITIVLTAAGGGYARKSDVVKFSNANSAGKQALITNVTSASSVDTITCQSVDGTPLYAATNDIVSFTSNASEEKSDKLSNRLIGQTKYMNQVQIFKEVDEITDVQKVAKVETQVNGQHYYSYKTHVDKVNTIKGQISAQMILGVGSTTLFSDTNPILTLNSRPVQTTMGLDQYTTLYGGSGQVASLGTVTATDVAAMIDILLANKAPLQQLGWHGSKARRPWDNFFKNLGSSGVTSVRLIMDGRDADFMVDSVSIYGADLEFAYLPIFDQPELFPTSVVPDVVGSMYWIPKDQVATVGGGSQGRLQLRYLPKAMAGGTTDGLITEWITGALAPVPTGSEQVMRTEWIANVGLEALGVKHFLKYRAI